MIRIVPLGYLLSPIGGCLFIPVLVGGSSFVPVLVGAFIGFLVPVFSFGRNELLKN